MLSAASGEKAPETPVDSVTGLRDVLINLDGMEEVERIAHQMPMLSSSLRPISRAYLESISTIQSMVGTMDSWLKAIGTE